MNEKKQDNKMTDLSDIKQLVEQLKKDEDISKPKPVPQKSSFQSEAFMALDRANQTTRPLDDVIDMPSTKKEIGSVVFERFSLTEKPPTQTENTEKIGDEVFLFKGSKTAQNRIREKETPIEPMFETQAINLSDVAKLSFKPIETSDKQTKPPDRELAVFKSFTEDMPKKDIAHAVEEKVVEQPTPTELQQKIEPKKTLYEIQEQKRKTQNPFEEYNRSVKKSSLAADRIYKKNVVTPSAKLDMPKASSHVSDNDDIKKIIEGISSPQQDIKKPQEPKHEFKPPKKRSYEDIYSSYSENESVHFGVKPKKSLLEFKQKKLVVIVAAAIVGVISVISIVLMLTGSTVYIIEDGQQIAELSGTVPDDVGAYLAKNDVVLIEQDTFSVSYEGDDAYININRAFPVSISIGETVKTVYTTETTVGELLLANEIYVPEGAVLSKGIDETVQSGDVIQEVDVEYEQRTETSAEAARQLTIESPLLKDGITHIATTDMVDGVATRTYQDVYIDGELVKTNLLYEDYDPHTVDSITLVGNSDATVSTLSAEFLDGLSIENGVPTEFETAHFSSDCTAYSFDPGIYGASGMHLSPGFVAVDPDVIPYGTLVYITSSDGEFVYGYAIAADYCEAAVSGIIDIDLFFRTYDESVMFGRRNLDVYVIKQLYQEDLSKFMSQQGMFEARVPVKS